MSRSYNIGQSVEGCIEHNGMEINYVVVWNKDLVTGNTDIESIEEVTITQDNGNGVWEENTEYYPEHRDEVQTMIYSDAYEKGEPVFEEECDVSYSQIMEAFAEQERGDL